MAPEHLPVADIVGFCEADLDPVWLELVWKHLDQCEKCVHCVALVLAVGRNR